MNTKTVPRFKKGDFVQDNCYCVYKVLKVGRKYYHLYNTEDKKFVYRYEIEMLDKSAFGVVQYNEKRKILGD